MLNVYNGSWHKVNIQQRRAVSVTMSITVMKGWGTVKRKGWAAQPAARGTGNSQKEDILFLCTEGW